MKKQYQYIILVVALFIYLICGKPSVVVIDGKSLASTLTLTMVGLAVGGYVGYLANRHFYLRQTFKTCNYELEKFLESCHRICSIFSRIDDISDCPNKDQVILDLWTKAELHWDNFKGYGRDIRRLYPVLRGANRLYLSMFELYAQMFFAGLNRASGVLVTKTSSHGWQLNPAGPDLVSKAANTNIRRLEKQMLFIMLKVRKANIPRIKIWKSMIGIKISHCVFDDVYFSVLQPMIMRNPVHEMLPIWCMQMVVPRKVIDRIKKLVG